MNTLIVRLSALMLFVALPAQSALAEMKIGFVNTIRLMEEAPQAKAASDKIEAEFGPREKQLVSLQREIHNLEEKLGRDGAVMSDSARNELDRDIRNRKRDLKRSQDEWREDLNIRRNEELGKLQRRLGDAIAGLAKEDGFDLIVSDGVVYFSDKVDITEKILVRLKNDTGKP